MTNEENGFQKDTKDLHSRRDEARADRVGGRKWEEKIDEEEEEEEEKQRRSHREEEGGRGRTVCHVGRPPSSSSGV